MLISKKLRWKNLRSFWNLYDFLIILVNYKPHKIRLYRLFMCYKCYEKLFLPIFEHLQTLSFSLLKHNFYLSFMLFILCL